MIKLTPAKRLKELRTKGYLDFIEYMESNNVTVRDICDGTDKGGFYLANYASKKRMSWISEDINYDMFNVTGDCTKMLGLEAQLAQLSQDKSVVKQKRSNKITKGFLRAKKCD
jgi:hypothetical protein